MRGRHSQSERRQEEKHMETISTAGPPGNGPHHQKGNKLHPLKSQLWRGPSANPAAGAAQVCPPPSNLRHGRDKRVFLNPKKCSSLVRSDLACPVWGKDILGAHHHHLSLPSTTAAQMSPCPTPTGALQDLIRTAHCTGKIAPGHL